MRKSYEKKSSPPNDEPELLWISRDGLLVRQRPAGYVIAPCVFDGADGPLEMLCRCTSWPRGRSVDGYAAAGAFIAITYRGSGTVTHRGFHAGHAATDGDVAASTIVAAADASRICGFSYVRFVVDFVVIFMFMLILFLFTFYGCMCCHDLRL